MTIEFNPIKGLLELVIEVENSKVTLPFGGWQTYLFETDAELKIQQLEALNTLIKIAAHTSSAELIEQQLNEAKQAIAAYKAYHFQNVLKPFITADIQQFKVKFHAGVNASLARGIVGELKNAN